MTVIIFIIGLAIGSFLNAWTWRMRHGGSVWKGRSYCPKCRKQLKWYELVPLVSFAAQLGRCRGCGQKIDWQYPLVELATGILFVLAFTCTKLSFVQVAVQTCTKLSFVQVAVQSLAFALIAVLIIVFIYDLRYGLVPNRVVLPAIVIAFLSRTVLERAQGLSWSALAIIVGAGFFWLQYAISKGRWLGAGDIWIGALMGAMLGWPLVIEGLIISYIIGGAVGLALLALGKKKIGQTLPLGTFLTLGTAIVFLYGEQITRFYLN